MKGSCQIPIQTVLVTGVSRGLGRALTEAFLQRGCHVIGAARTRTESLDWISSYRENLSYHCCDLRDPDQICSLLWTLDREKIQPDLIIFNAGCALEDVGTGMKADLVQEQFSLHLFSGLQILEHYLPKMLAKGKGAVAVVSSLAVFRENHSGRLGYSASKQAMIRIFENLRLQHADSGVSFVTIFPGRMGGRNAWGMGIDYPVAARKICRALLASSPPEKLSFPFIQAVATKLLHHCPTVVFRRLFYR